MMKEGYNPTQTQYRKTMTFLSTLLPSKAKVQPVQHYAALVKMLVKKSRVFFINMFTLFCLQLRHFYLVKPERGGNEEAADPPSPSPRTR